MTTAGRVIFNKNPGEFIERAIARFIQKSPSNRRKADGGKYWEVPLVGFASSKDPLFRQYKKIIGKFHYTPQEIFKLTFGKESPSKELSIISWIIPASEDIRKSNRREKTYPSLLWAHTRYFGERFNARLRNHVVSLLRRKGYQAVAPMNSPYFKRIRSSKVGLASNWSERHVAYACGLGTFGLSDGLITEKGKAIRIGSVVTDLHLTPSEKIYPHHRANCLYYSGRTCRACAARCPAGAITSKGHDKDKCYGYSFGVATRDKGIPYGVKITGCGLCQTGVPCEFEIPKRIQRDSQQRREVG